MISLLTSPYVWWAAAIGAVFVLALVALVQAVWRWWKGR